jgi:hypothetical protein
MRATDFVIRTVLFFHEDTQPTLYEQTYRYPRSDLDSTLPRITMTAHFGGFGEPHFAVQNDKFG